MSDKEPKEVMIGIAYGHPSGAVQAFHPESGLKQIGESPEEAISELWSILEKGGHIEDKVTTHDKLVCVEEGDSIEVRVVDFENTRYPKDNNPRTIEGKVENINEDVSHSAGEVQRVITIGDVWDEGCKIDVGNTSKNQLAGGSNNPRKYVWRPRRKYTRVWRPRSGKDRVLLGKVKQVIIEDE